MAGSMERYDAMVMLNLEQIHIFLSVAGHLHFSRAAEDLYLSQPAVSATIAKLEAQAGLSLFHRIGRRVELTDAGRFLQRDGQLLVEQAARVEQGLQDFHALQRGCLQLGASFTVGNYWLPQHLLRFSSLHPGIELPCQLANAEMILDGTESGRFDLGFVCGRRPPGAAQVVGTELLCLVVGPQHPWAGHGPMAPERLLEAGWLLREHGSGARAMLEEFLGEIGLSAEDLRVSHLLHSNEMLKAMVAAGAGIAALPASMVRQDIQHGLLRAITLIDHPCKADPIWMVCSPGRRGSQLVNRFQDLVLASAEGPAAA